MLFLRNGCIHVYHEIQQQYCIVIHSTFILTSNNMDNYSDIVKKCSVISKIKVKCTVKSSEESKIFRNIETVTTLKHLQTDSNTFFISVKRKNVLSCRCLNYECKSTCTAIYYKKILYIYIYHDFN